MLGILIRHQGSQESLGWATPTWWWIGNQSSCFLRHQKPGQLFHSAAKNPVVIFLPKRPSSKWPTSLFSEAWIICELIQGCVPGAARRDGAPFHRFLCVWKWKKGTPSYGVLLMGKKTKKPTVDGCEILHQLVEGLYIPFKSHYLQCFTVTNSCQLVQDFVHPQNFQTNLSPILGPLMLGRSNRILGTSSDESNASQEPSQGLSIFIPHCYSSYSHFHREHEVLIHRNWGFCLWICSTQPCLRICADWTPTIWQQLCWGRHDNVHIGNCSLLI